MGNKDLVKAIKSLTRRLELLESKLDRLLGETREARCPQCGTELIRSVSIGSSPILWCPKCHREVKI